MRLLDRYLLREFLSALVICFCAFVLLWITTELFGEIHKFQEAHLRASEIVQYYLFRIPEFLPIALPLTLLVGLLYALTNHSRYNEITAMRAAGVSLGRLCVPYFVVGILASAGLFAIDELYAPKAADAADEILNHRIVRRMAPGDRYKIAPLNFINSNAGGKGRVWNVASYNTKTFEMTLPQVIWTPTNSATQLWLIASSAIWTNHAWLFRGDVEEDIQSNGIPLRVMKTTNDLAMPEFTERPREIQSEININNYRDTARTAKTRSADVPLTDIISYLRLHPHPDRKTRNWLYTKLHGRFAGPLVCLVAVLVAIPFAAGSGRRNVAVGVAASIFIFFAYFALQQVGFAFGESGWVPSWFGAWFPDLFFGIGGLILMARVR